MWAKARLTAIHEAMIDLRGESPYDEKWLDRPGHDHRITTDSTSATSCGRAAVRCGPTPRRSIPTEPWWFGLTDEELADVYPWEDWILARSLVGTPAAGEFETDLFAGDPGAGVAMNIQYRVAFGKKDEAVDGPDDAEVVVTIAAADAALDPTVAFMQGKLKSTGSTGRAVRGAAQRRRRRRRSAGSHRVPELAIADQHRAAGGEQLDELSDRW